MKWRKYKMINNEYTPTIYKYVELAKEVFKENLDMILVIGSSCSNKVVKDWSDIDVILVFDKIDDEIIEKIKCISNLYTIKIGTTIYQKDEFVMKKIDSKTFYHLYLAQNSEIDIQYLKNGFYPPIISSSEVKEIFELYLNERLHVFKRYFLYSNLTKQQTRDFYKSMYLLMKTKLIIDGYCPKNYEEVFKLFSEKYNFELFDYQEFINRFQKGDDDYQEQLIESSKRLLKRIYN